MPTRQCNCRFNFILPALKVSGGVKETVKIADELASYGCRVELISMWRGVSEVDSKHYTKFLSEFTASKVKAIYQIFLIFLKFVDYYSFKKKIAEKQSIGNELWVFTHYSTFPLAMLIPENKRLFFVQGKEWQFENKRIFNFFLKKIIFYFYKQGRVLSANKYLTGVLRQEGVQIYAEMPIWADAEFYSKVNQDRIFDFVMVLRRGPVKRLDMYLEFISKCLYSGEKVRLAVISPDKSIIDIVSNTVEHCYLDPTVKQMKSIYGQSKFFIMLSENEGFGLPPLEAMGSGCVPICRDSGGVNAYMIGVLAKNVLSRDLDINEIFEYAISVLNDEKYDELPLFCQKIFYEGLGNVKNRTKMLLGLLMC